MSTDHVEHELMDGRTFSVVIHRGPSPHIVDVTYAFSGPAGYEGPYLQGQMDRCEVDAWVASYVHDLDAAAAASRPMA